MIDLNKDTNPKSNNLAKPVKSNGLKKPIKKLADAKKDVDFEIEHISDLSYDTIAKHKVKKVIWDPNGNLIIAAHKKIGELWNRDQKSRNFIKHLIAAFLPIDQWARLMNSDEDCKCAILGDRLYGISEISENIAKLSMKKMMIDAHCAVEKREKYNDEELVEMETLRKTIPQNILDCRVAYGSDNSDKYLSQEANLALYYFSVDMIFVSDELNYTLKKKMLKNAQHLTETQLDNKEINKVVKNQTYGSPLKDGIDNNVLEKLRKMKNELEADEKKKHQSHPLINSFNQY